MKTQFSAQVDKVVAKKDRTLSVVLGTQEMSAESASEVLQLMNQQIWVGMSETKIESLEIPEFIPEFKGEKSHSQRLKEVLYLLWRDKSDQSKTSDQFYRDYVEKVIVSVKDKLD